MTKVHIHIRSGINPHEHGTRRPACSQFLWHGVLVAIKLWIAALILLSIAGCSSRFQDVQTSEPIKWDTKTKQQCWDGKTEFDETASYATSVQKEEMELKASERGESDLLNTLAIEQHLAEGGFEGPLCSDLAHPPTDPYVKAWWNWTFLHEGSPYVEPKVTVDVMEHTKYGKMGPYALRASNLHYYVGADSIEKLTAPVGGFGIRSGSNAICLRGVLSYNRLTADQKSLVQGACRHGLPIYEGFADSTFPLIGVCQAGTGDILAVPVTAGVDPSYLLVKDGKYYVGSISLRDKETGSDSEENVYFNGYNDSYEQLGADQKSLVQDFCRRGLPIYEASHFSLVSVCQK